MKFSLFYIPACQEGETYKHEFEQLIEQCEVADELGYDTVFLAEHHFSRVGMCPDALMVALAIAQRTKKIRIGTAICIMPFHNPVRLAEQAALVDVLSGGRLELGVGRGSQPKEFQGFNISPTESREKMQEGLEVMTRLLEGECLTFHGKHYSCIDAEIFPKPIQKPRPPIWLAGTSPETYVFAGQSGYNIMASGTFKGPDVYLEKMALFNETVRSRGGDPNDYPSLMAHHVHVCDDPEHAWKQIEPSESWYLSYRSAVNSIEMPLEEKEALKRNWNYDVDIRQVIEGGGVIGPPDKVIADLKRLQEEFQVNHIMIFVLRGIAQDEAIQSLERFAKEVMPAFQEERAASSND